MILKIHGYVCFANAGNLVSFEVRLYMLTLERRLRQYRHPLVILHTPKNMLNAGNLNNAGSVDEMQA